MSSRATSALIRRTLCSSTRKAKALSVLLPLAMDFGEKLMARMIGSRPSRAAASSLLRPSLASANKGPPAGAPFLRISSMRCRAAKLVEHLCTPCLARPIGLAQGLWGTLEVPFGLLLLSAKHPKISVCLLWSWMQTRRQQCATVALQHLNNKKRTNVRATNTLIWTRLQ